MFVWFAGSLDTQNRNYCPNALCCIVANKIVQETLYRKCCTENVVQGNGVQENVVQQNLKKKY